MHVLTVSDIVASPLYPVSDRASLGPVDLIVACGDLPPEYLSYLAHAFNVPLLFVKGNHDIRSENYPPRGCTDINGRILTFQGVRFLGLEGSMWYNGGPNQYTEGEMGKRVLRLRPRLWWGGGVDVIITHAPPRHIHDEEDLCHRGFRTFRRLIERSRPRYFIHGHIHTHFDHPSERITVFNDTEVINTYGHHTFEIEADGPAEKPGR